MPKALQIQRVFMLWESSIKLSKSGIIQSLDVNLRYLWVPKHCKKKNISNNEFTSRNYVTGKDNSVDMVLIWPLPQKHPDSDIKLLKQRY